ncbi:MAG: isopenicillin N synthase family dioxygenase [Alphaproteobacteria bacterium]
MAGVGAAGTIPPGVARAPFTAVPMIEIGPYLAGGPAERRAVARQVAAAAEHVGFFYVRGHGVPEAVIERAFAASRRFFALPLEEKRAVDIAITPNHRGYMGAYGATPDPATGGPDLNEVFKVGLETGRDDPAFRGGNILYGPNAWPSGLPGFREAMYGYYEAILALAARMFGLFALALDLPEDHFAGRLGKPASVMNVLHYPPADPANPAKTSGVGAHSDYECFAILAQDSVGGLEIRNQAGAWVPAPPVAGSFVVNIGDMMARWTNDRFASTMHRVITRSGRDRYSIAFFGNCDFDTPVSCLESCQGPGNPPRYPPTTVGEHLMASIRRVFHYLEDKERRARGAGP